MLNRNKITANQSGFTLVEIAIVLVIIGLLLGGVLKGQQLIENAKVKNAVNDLNGVSAAYFAYIDRFKRTPGDDGPIATLNLRGGLWAAAAGFPNAGAGNNNGVLGPIVAAATFTGAGEGDNFWIQLKAAELITGSPVDVGIPALSRNAFGGLTGVTTDDTVMGLMPGVKVCMSQVPGKAARAIDTQLDDGVGTTGSIRNTVGAAGANTVPAAAVAAYSDDSIYTICRAL